ncbi:hypothetical protein I5677_04375 [Mobilitalea sibirica]|uniref:YhhN-like protein n=1 Tax=Mobilitalea sibirica TaxID=1462919 RepID=A0A8J7H8B4_9FIRM|nr:hypothetical protein [Mobilitalea sibirica]MBH1940130.1 hypothetical protein [Mobilitalea sibirica]
MKPCAVRRIIRYLFLTLQTVLYLVFLSFDLSGDNTVLSNRIKFSLIIVCFCYVLFRDGGTSKSHLYILRTALFLTVISDLFILILDNYLFGIWTFIIVQQLYAIRLNLLGLSFTPGDKKHRKLLRAWVIRNIFLTIITILLCSMLKAFGVIIDWLLISSLFYFVSIVMNVFYSIKIAILKPYKISNIVFASGMVLFLLCDINVGIFNLTDFIFLPQHIYEKMYLFSSFLMWAFYAPSQILIALSADYE